jgi:hypothetical protein
MTRIGHRRTRRVRAGACAPAAPVTSGSTAISGAAEIVSAGASDAGVSSSAGCVSGSSWVRSAPGGTIVRTGLGAGSKPSRRRAASAAAARVRPPCTRASPGAATATRPARRRARAPARAARRWEWGRRSSSGTPEDAAPPRRAAGGLDAGADLQRLGARERAPAARHEAVGERRAVLAARARLADGWRVGERARHHVAERDQLALDDLGLAGLALIGRPPSPRPCRRL